MRGYAYLGGSFNPPHIGHLRVALEVAENFADRLERVFLLPCAHPPHKEEGKLLPFAMRCDMLELALQDAERYPHVRRSTVPIAVSRLEGERDTPSYTWDTVSSLASAERNRPLFFIMGSDDYMQLHTWHEGLSLPKKTNLVVVPRDGFSDADFDRETRRLWPDVVREEGRAHFTSGHESFFLNIPPLAISATALRKRFLQGSAVTFLVPEAVATYLAAHRSLVSRIWEDQ